MRQLLLRASPCLLVLLAPPRAVLDHDGGVTPQSLWQRWGQEPLILLGLGLAALIYGRGLVRLWGHAGVGRGVRRWQAAAVVGGLAALVVALASPLAALAEALFVAHMVQHLLLMLVAAPLLVLGEPLLPLLWALPLTARQRVGRWWKRADGLHSLADTLARPLVAWGLYAGTLWLWHLPRLYQAALAHEAVHVLEHGLFFGVALLFWGVVGSFRGHRGQTAGAGVLFVFTTALQSGALGALLTLAPAPWYAFYASRVGAWGLTPLEDQQLGGAVMWVPPSVLYLVVAAVLFVLFLRALERRLPSGHREQRVRTTAAALPPDRDRKRNT